MTGNSKVCREEGWWEEGIDDAATIGVGEGIATEDEFYGWKDRDS